MNGARTLALRLLRVPCGAYGGKWETGHRWCWKRFGHPDSHAYDVGKQPLEHERLHAQGWDE